MRSILVHDARLEGETSHGGEIMPITVGGDTSLDEMVEQVRSASIRFGTDVRLGILCHGFENHGELGYGLQLCREYLLLRTVENLRPLDGYISYGIDIYACGAAHTASWQVGRHGDGWLLCSRVASITRSVVRAAVLTQYYRYFNGVAGLFRQPIDFGRREGSVLTFDALGNQVASELNPAR